MESRRIRYGQSGEVRCGLSLDTHFYVQRLVAGRWAVPPDFAHCDAPRCTCRHTGYFARFGGRPRLLDLFHSAGTGARPPFAVFEVYRDPPPGIGDTGLFHPADSSRVESLVQEWWQFWVPWPELLTGSWSRQQLLISGSVPAQYAPLLGDGAAPLPRRDLLAAGMSPEVLAALADRSQGDAADAARVLAAEPARPIRLTPGHWVRVTWSVTLDEFIGAQAEKFHAVARCGPAEQLRAICLRH
jgi:hypothetical protein